MIECVVCDKQKPTGEFSDTAIIITKKIVNITHITINWICDKCEDDLAYNYVMASLNRMMNGDGDSNPIGVLNESNLEWNSKEV
jgi:uncharacterized protein YlaI